MEYAIVFINRSSYGCITSVIVAKDKVLYIASKTLEAETSV